MDERELEKELDDLDDGGSTGDVDLSELESDTTATGGGDVGLDESELGVDVDSLTGEPGSSGSTGRSRSQSKSEAGGAEATDETTGQSRAGLGSRLGGAVRNPAAGLPSGQSLLLSFVVTLVFMFGIGTFVPLPGSNLLGIFAGAFALGAVSGKRRYLPLALAGGVALGLTTVLGSAFLAFATGKLPLLAALGAGGGILVSVLGHYFGRDLRGGLTRDVDEEF